MKKQVKAAGDFLYRVAASRWFRVAILAVFAAQALFLVGAMHIGTPPDEQNHIEFVEFYADHSLSPIFDKQTPTWNLGDKTREIDYLYHYGASFVARVVPGKTADVYAIRAVTVMTALLTFLVLIKIFERLKISDSAINVTLAILTNLPMVLMLSAAVNNDVAVWLGTVLGVWLLLRLWQKPQLFDALLLLDVAALGGLVKRTLLPVAMVFVILLVIFVVRQWAVFKKSLAWKNWKIIVAFIVLLIGSGLFIERVGGNLMRYHSPTPSCEVVQGDEACSVFWVNSRKEWLNDFDADGSASSNNWLGDAKKDTQLLPLPVFAAQWFGVSMFNVVDIQTQSWRHEVGPASWLTPLLIIVFLGSLAYGIVRDIRHRKTDPVAYKRLIVMALGIFIIVLQLGVNYDSYQQDHVFGLALNGRYILPALLLLGGLCSFYITKLLTKRWRIVMSAVMIGAVLVGSGISMMIRNPQLFHG